MKSSNKKNVSRTTKRRRGQGMTESIIIVGLIAITMVAAVTTFKDSLDGAYEKGSEQITKKVTEEMDK